MALIFHFKISSAIRFNMDQTKILSSANGLRRTKHLGNKEFPILDLTKCGEEILLKGMLTLWSLFPSS